MNDAPIGFLMALSKDEKALSAYAALPRGEKDIVLEKARRCNQQHDYSRLLSELKNK